MLTAISLYTGIGGLDFGFEAAGYRTLVAAELDPVSCRMIRRNRKRWSVLEGDIHEFDSDTILSSAGVGVGEADVLIGGPPCQPFSKSGYWANGDAGRLDGGRRRGAADPLHGSHRQQNRRRGATGVPDL